MYLISERDTVHEVQGNFLYMQYFPRYPVNYSPRGDLT